MEEDCVTFDPEKLEIGTAFIAESLGLVIAKSDEKTIRIYQLVSNSD